VGPVLVEHRHRLPSAIAGEVERLASVSRWLRKERELSFYGDIDFIPTEQYTRADALRAQADALFVLAQAQLGIAPGD
jgi:hypothetical protein